MRTLATPGTQPRIDVYGLNTVAKHLTQAFVTGALLFVGAGTLDWDRGWAFAICCAAGWVGLTIALALGNPALLNHRGQRVKQATVGSKRWDLVLLGLYFAVSLLEPFVAGLDRRSAWSAPTPAFVSALGNALLLAGFALLTWAMLSNRFFEPSVRLQGAQQVETGGPYRFVRHPGYVGLILQLLALPVAVGAWAALLPGLAGALIFVARTALEDRTLQTELPGYAEYARRTRYRLVPGLW